MATRHGLPDGYRENPGCYFVDDVTATRGIVFQPDVYHLAEALVEMIGAGVLIDVGCGWGEKLRSIALRHPDWKLVGIDHGANLEHCRASGDWAGWAERDLETIDPDGLRAAAGSVIVAADVVEHLRDPVPLVRALARSGARAVVLSTPERELEHGARHRGPPPNPCHVREWTAAELRSFLVGEGLRVRFVGLTRGCDQSEIRATTIVVAIP